MAKRNINIAKIKKIDLDPKNFFKRLSDAAVVKGKIQQRVAKIETEFTNRVAKQLESKLRNSSVIKALGEDELLAHFGEYDRNRLITAGNTIVFHIVHNIRSVVRINVKVAGSDEKVQLIPGFAKIPNFILPDRALEEFLTPKTLFNRNTIASINVNIPTNILGKIYKHLMTLGYQHDNPNGNVEATIDWMRWILKPNDGPVGVRGKSVGIQIGGLTPKQKGSSRSGLAIMVKKSQEPVGIEYPYRLPSVLRPLKPGSANFIEDILFSEEFNTLIGTILNQAVNKTLTGRLGG